MMLGKLIIICCLLFTVSCFGQTLSTENEAFIDSLVMAAYPDTMPGISVLISKGGKTIYSKAFGIADMEQNKILRPQNVFAIGSMSKQITAIAALMLIQEGKLNLNDDIRKFFPDYNTYGKSITLENLLTHTSGIPSYTEMKSFPQMIQIDKTPEEILNTFKDSALLFDPGTNWSYSNSGFMLMAYIVEKVSGMSFNDFLKEKIFHPLGMNDTYIGSNTEVIPNRAVGYDPLDSIHVQKTAYYSWTWPYGAGSIMSTTADMLKWDEALYTDKLVSKDLLSKAWTTFVLPDGRRANYGYGWAVNDLNGHKIIFHGGAIGGYLSQGIRIPDEHLYVAGLTNTTVKSPDDVINKIAMRLLGYDTKMPDAISVSKSSLNDYAGVFEATMNSLRIVTNMGDEKEYRYVTVKDDTLWVLRSGGQKRNLIPIGTDKFYIQNQFRIFQFQRDAGNKVVSISISDYPIQYGPVEISMKTNLAIPEDKKEITVDEEILKKYPGTFEVVPGFDLVVTVRNGKIYAQATGQTEIELHATDNTHFFIKEVDAQVDFNSDSTGNISSLTLTQGQKMECRKIK